MHEAFYEAPEDTAAYSSPVVLATSPNILNPFKMVNVLTTI